MLYAQVHLTLPDWIHAHVDDSRAYPSDEDKVALAIELSRMNVQERSGGPFGAVVFGPDHRIIAAAVNRVVPQTTSLAHARKHGLHARPTAPADTAFERCAGAGNAGHLGAAVLPMLWRHRVGRHRPPA